VPAEGSHPDHLVNVIPGAERHELPAGHVLQDSDLDAVYAWLHTTAGGTATPSK